MLLIFPNSRAHFARSGALCALLIVSACDISLPFIGDRNGGRGAGAAAEDTRPIARPDANEEAPDEAASADTPTPAGALGTTSASLGDATRAGLWLETPLISATGPGRLTAADGTTLDVTLIPSAGQPGSGSRISLQAMQALGLPLTSIAEIGVEAL